MMIPMIAAGGDEQPPSDPRLERCEGVLEVGLRHQVLDELLPSASAIASA